LVLSLVAKVFLLGRGYLSNPDEYRHVASQDAIEFLKKGEVKSAVKQLFEVQGRPGLALVGMIPAAFQNIIANALKVGYNGHEAAWVIYIYNFIIFLFILLLLFKISSQVGLSREIGLTVVLLYSLSINGYIYLRHIFPYDFSLLLLLLAFWYFLSKKAIWNLKHGFVFGFIAAFAFIVYPGYFPVVMALGLFFVLSVYSGSGLKLLLRHSLISAAGGVFLFAIFELLAQYCGVSYLLDAKQLSGTITQGSFEESFSFIFKYLWQAEFPLGILYLVSLFTGIFFLVQDFKTGSNVDTSYLYLCLFIGFVIYAALGQFFHKMVFYGRLVHQFYPFLALLFGYSIHKIFLSKPKWPAATATGISAIVILLLSLPNHFVFADMHYPREIMDKVKPFESKYQIVSYCERQSHIDNSAVINKDTSTQAKPKLYLINCCYPTGPDLPGDFSGFNAPDSSSVILSYDHFINMTAYQFEGGNIEQRAQYRKNPLYLQAYK